MSNATTVEVMSLFIFSSRLIVPIKSVKGRPGSKIGVANISEHPLPGPVDEGALFTPRDRS
jgi:hypothetical protein